MEATPRGVVLSEVAKAGKALDAVRELLREYMHAEAARVYSPDWENEFAGLPGPYGPPRGCLLLAQLGGVPAGCVALRPLAESHCEMKRLYVRTAFRGAGLAVILVERLIARARALGYREMYLDTLPEMRAARLMYDMLGFRPCPPYLPEPTAGADCLVLELNALPRVRE